MSAQATSRLKPASAGVTSYTLALGLSIVYLVLGGLGAFVGARSAVIPYGAVAVLAAILAFLAVHYTLARKVLPFLPARVQVPSSHLFAAAVAGFIALIVAFSELSRSLYLTYGGFSAHQAGYWYWLRFGVSYALDGVLFGALQTFGISVSDIQPITPWARALVVGYNVVLDVLALVALFHWLRIAQKRWDRPTKIEPATYLRFLATRLRRLAATLVWVVPLLICAAAVSSNGYAVGSTSKALGIGVPLAVGLWLAVQGREASRMSGSWNKVGAVASTLLGLAIAIAGPAITLLG